MTAQIFALEIEIRPLTFAGKETLFVVIQMLGHIYSRTPNQQTHTAAKQTYSKWPKIDNSKINYNDITFDGTSNVCIISQLTQNTKQRYLFDAWLPSFH